MTWSDDTMASDFFRHLLCISAGHVLLLYHFNTFYILLLIVGLVD